MGSISPIPNLRLMIINLTSLILVISVRAQWDKTNQNREGALETWQVHLWISICQTQV